MAKYAQTGTDLLLRLASWNEKQFGSGTAPTRKQKWKPDVLAGPAPRFASEAIGAYRDKVRKLGDRIRKLDTVEFHRLRIGIKKLRYASEFFDGFPQAVQAEYCAYGCP